MRTRAPFDRCVFGATLKSSTEGRYKPRPRRISLHELTNNNAGSWSKKGPSGSILLTMVTHPIF